MGWCVLWALARVSFDTKTGCASTLIIYGHGRSRCCFCTCFCSLCSYSSGSSGYNNDHNRCSKRLTVVAAIRVAVTTHVVAVSVTVFQEAISSVTMVLVPILGGRENLANCLGTRNNSLALTTFANLVVCWSQCSPIWTRRGANTL